MRTYTLTNLATTLTKKFYDSAGTQADAGTVTVGIVDANGDEVVASGTATTKSGTGATTQYTYTLAAQSEVAVLYVTWTSSGLGTAVDVVEVVGGELFSLNEARSATISGLQTPLSSTSDYPADTIKSWHLYIADLFEQRTGQSFFPRYGRMLLRGDDSYVGWFPEGLSRSAQGYPLGNGGESRDIRRIISVTVDGVAQTVANYAVDLRGVVAIYTDFPIARNRNPYNVVVEYEYGRFPVPGEARQNALRLLLANAVASDLPSRATSFNNEDGTFRLTTHPVEVEEFLRANNRRGLM